MALDYVIDREKKLVISTATGVFTATDAFTHQNKLRSDPNFSGDFSQLLDFSAVTSVQIDSGSIALLAHATIYSEKSRRAFVVHGALTFGLARMFGTYRDIAKGKEQIRVFENRSGAMARAWRRVNRDNCIVESGVRP